MAHKMIDETYCPYVRAMRKNFLCDTDEDFATLPECCVGSTAVSLKTGNVRVVNSNGEWVPFGGE